MDKKNARFKILTEEEKSILRKEEGITFPGMFYVIGLFGLIKSSLEMNTF